MKTDAEASPTSRLFGPGNLSSRPIANMEKCEKSRAPLDANFGTHGGSLWRAAALPTVPERLALS